MGYAKERDGGSASAAPSRFVTVQLPVAGLVPGTYVFLVRLAQFQDVGGRTSPATGILVWFPVQNFGGYFTSIDQ